MQNLALNYKEVQKHGSDATYQNSLTANQQILANLIAQYFGIKVTEDVLTEFIGDVNTQTGVSIL